MHLEPDVNQNNFEHLITSALTKRVVLIQNAIIYDPLGLVTPFTLQGKILMRELVLGTIVKDGEERRLDWDDPIPSHMYEKWKCYFQEML